LVTALDGSSTMPWLWAFLPLVIVGVVVAGVIFLIVVGLLISRRITINLKTGGAVALTVAWMVLLSGLWCMFLSPTATYTETKESFYNRIPISGLRGWSYLLSVKQGDSLIGSIDIFRIQTEPTSEKAFSWHVYDPDSNLLRSEINSTYAVFNVNALKSGLYKVEILNQRHQSIECYVQISVNSKLEYRPLDALGQWLSLVSLPLFGLGIWTSGLLSALRREPVR